MFGPSITRFLCISAVPLIRHETGDSPGAVTPRAISALWPFCDFQVAAPLNKTRGQSPSFFYSQ